MIYKITFLCVVTSWTIILLGVDMQLDKMLKQDNLGCTIIFAKMGDDKNFSGDFLEINGANFKKTRYLEQMPLASLQISDSSINSLDFLNSSIIQQHLSTLRLINNKLLCDYSGLKNSRVKTLILSEHNFCDVSFVGLNVKNLFLLNTSISKMDFLNPDQLELLVLSGNVHLCDLSPINQMRNLRRLETDNLHNADLRKLKKLDFITFNGIPQVSLPPMPDKTFKFIVILGGENLSDIESLRGVETERMDLLLLEGQLNKFLPILKTMKIGELRITDDVKNLSLARNLDCANIIKFNNNIIEKQ